MAQCIVAPKVKNKDGEFITAPLYEELKKIVGDNLALNIYNILTSEDMKASEEYKYLTMDEYDMPTIESVKEFTDLYQFIDKIRYGNQIAKEIIGKSEFSMYDTMETLSILDKIVKFNENSKFVIALPIYDISSRKYSISVSPVNNTSLQYAEQFKNYANNCKIYANALHNAGFSSKFIASQISSNYNVKYPSQLNAANFNPNGILESALNLKQLKAVDARQIGMLLKNDFAGNPLYTRLDGMLTAKDNINFVYNYMRDNNLINESVSIEDVKKDASYTKMVINHMIAEALTNGFSLLNKKLNEQIIRRVEYLTNEVKRKIDKIDTSKIPEGSKTETNNEFKRDVKVPLKKRLKDIGAFKDIATKTNTNIALMEKLINSEYNRYNLAVRTGDINNIGKCKRRINFLQEMQEANTLNTAFIEFLEEQTEELIEAEKNMTKAMASDKESTKSFAVRQTLQLCDYYINCIEYFNDYMNKATSYKSDLKEELKDMLGSQNVKIDIDSEEGWNNLKQIVKNRIENPGNFTEEVIDWVKQLDALISSYEDIENNPMIGSTKLADFTATANSLRSEAQKNAIALTAEFLKKFQTEKASYIPWGKKVGEEIDIEKELVEMQEDINLYDMYLDAMADCPDVIGRLTDKAIKTTKTNIRIDATNKAKEIMKEAKILEEAGVKGFDWMYERKEDGKKTKEYVKPNSESFNKNIANNPAKLRFYNYFMSVKHEIDRYYPNNAANYNIIGIRKDRLERLKRANGIKDFGKQIWEGVKDNYINREDDIEIQGYTEAFTDIGGNEVKILPKYYNHVTDSNAEHMSEDAVTTLIAYAYRGIEYHSMVGLVNSIELEREVLKNRLMPVESKGKKVLNVAKKMFYKDDSENLDKSTLKTKDDGKSNFYKRWTSYVDANIYGISRKEEGNIGPISKAKLIDQLNKKTAISALSLNLLNGISNIATGTCMTRIESFCQQYFTFKDMVWADKEYFASMPSYLAEKGNRIKDSKLHLFMEMFDVLQDFDSTIAHNDWMRDSWFKRICNSEFLSVIQNAGENYMNVRIALALAHFTKLKTASGKETNLYEMLEVEYLQEDGKYGSENKKFGARLKLKEKCFNSDGSEFVLDNETIHKISRKMAGINQGVHGIYNQQDANLIQQYAIGRLLYMFRKWIPKSLDKRFANLKYNYDIDEWTEGYYQTLLHFITGLVREHNGMKLEIALRWKSLNPIQQANCKRALAEITQFYSVLIANMGIFKWRDDDDKSGYSWAMNMLYYQSIRLQSELAALQPTSLLGSRDNMVSEFIRMFKNPIAALSPVSDAIKLSQLFYPSTWTDTVQRGPYKGYSKVFVVFFGNKFLFPIGAMIPKNIGPENYVGYYLMN